ncbi:hypothetical protein B0H19DRAFT_947189, partial [Mycena capillaripes]
IEQYNTLYVEYQSEVDWRSTRDILRCNPHFHGTPRYDCVIYSASDDPLAMGPLKLLFRCRLPGNVCLDLAMILSSWKPKTRTDCPIRAQASAASSKFIALTYVIRGVFLCPIFAGRAGMFYVVDCIDEDMYLRINNTSSVPVLRHGLGAMLCLSKSHKLTLYLL